MSNVLLFLLFLSPFALCGDVVSISGGISGRVVDSKQGNPVPLVQVRTTPVSGVAVTGPDGKYRLNGLKPGKYTVIASKPGYFEHKVAVAVSSENTTVDMLLTPRRSQTPVVHGLVSHFQFDGSTRDLIGNGPDASLSNVQWAPDRLGKPDCALRFNGVSSYARLGNILAKVFSAPIAKFTVSGWAKTAEYPHHPGGGSLVAKAAGGTYGPYQWALCHDQDGRVKALVASSRDATAFLQRQSEVVPLGQWFHFALVFDGSLSETERVRLYVNGVAGEIEREEGKIGTTTEDTDQEITVGGTHHAGDPHSAGNFYQGMIDDIRIYDKALSQAEIQALWDPGKQ